MPDRNKKLPHAIPLTNTPDPSSDETMDQAAWQLFINEANVLPIDTKNRYLRPVTLPKPVPLFLELPKDPKEAAWSDPCDIEHVHRHIRAGYPPKLLKQLRRGKFRCNSELDLHGHTRNQAREALYFFLKEAIYYKDPCVCIIVGKGKGSKESQAILPVFVKHWLIQEPTVIAFCEAPVNQGGAGAIFVLLKINGLQPDS